MISVLVRLPHLQWLRRDGQCVRLCGGINVSSPKWLVYGFRTSSIVVQSGRLKCTCGPFLSPAPGISCIGPPVSRTKALACFPWRYVDAAFSGLPLGHALGYALAYVPPLRRALLG